MLLFEKVRDMFRHLLELLVAYYILGFYESIKINDSQYWFAFVRYTQHYINCMQHKSFPGSS